jgi:SAM-dependent methyltransferase
MKIGLPLRQAIIGWDSGTWGQCLDFWLQYVPDLKGKDVLELGASQGGLSLYFALQEAQVLCSDLTSPEAKARPLHQAYGQSQIRYLALDAKALDLPDQSQDLVVFKSVLGGIRRGAETDPKPLVMAEILRVLRPGGWLLFAENLIGAHWHMFLRKQFVSWAAYWDYLSLPDLQALTQPFAESHYQTAGILALCGRTEFQRQQLSRLDRVLQKKWPENQCYCVFVAARKASDLT